MDESLTVLVTGATGLVGAEVTARLAAAGHRVVALVHRSPELVRNNGTRVPASPYLDPPAPGTVARLAGDVTVPGLGLPDGELAELSLRLDRIVHCAAVVEFGLPDEVYAAVNVAGTAHVVELARLASTPLVHVSTAYLCGERNGEIREDELDVGQRFGNAYERSKLRAETLVRAARAEGLPAAVVRPSVVVGADRSGMVRDFKNFYTVLKLTTEGKSRSLPGHYEAVIDLVPVDYVADVVTEATVRFASAEGRTFHAIGRPVTLRDFSDVLAEYPSFHVPRFVPPTTFSVAALAPDERPYYERILSLYVSYFRRINHFDNTALRGWSGIRPPASSRSGNRAYLRRLFDYCLRVGYLGDPLPAVAEVLARFDRLEPIERAEQVGVR